MINTSSESPAAPTSMLRRYAPYLIGGLLLVLALALMTGSCTQDMPDPAAEAQRDPQTEARYSDELFQYAMGNLNRLEQYQSPEMLRKVVERFDHWLRLQHPPANWKPDPLIATLPPPLQRLPQLGALDELSLSSTQNTYHYFQQTAWLRDVARKSRSQSADDLSRATALFDWTVRNIQLEPAAGDDDTRQPLLRWPAHTLLIGRGTARERAWLFVLLARQLRLDAVMLALGDPAHPEQLKSWLPALLSDGQLYLFDPELGLPIPGPGGEGVATLAQAAADDQILRRLDLDAEHPYSVTSEDVQQVNAWIEASPPALSRAMQLIEAASSGDDKLVLSVRPTQLAKRLRTVKHVAGARLWPLPFETYLFYSGQDPAQIQRALDPELLPYQAPSPLFQGRVYHLKGIYTSQNVDAKEPTAIRLYQAVRAPDEFVDQVQPEYLASARTAKQNATYWLGVIALERGHYDTAIDYLQDRVLKASPDGPWTNGARYNLARAYEADGQIDQAVQQYEADTSPQRHGNLLRARWLKAE